MHNRFLWVLKGLETLEHILKMWVRVKEAHCCNVRRYSSVLLSDMKQQGGEALGPPQVWGVVDFNIWIGMQRGERMETFKQKETEK